MTNVSAIVAVGRNGEMGAGGKLPWPRSPEDAAWFRRHTLNKFVVMGRKTWESLPARWRPLPGRSNLVLSSDESWAPEFGDYNDAHGTTTLEVFRSAGGVMRYLAPVHDTELVVVGGVRVYEAFWPYVTVLRVTRFDAEFPDADTFFPYNDLPAWGWREGVPLRGRTPGLTFHTYRRRLVR